MKTSRQLVRRVRDAMPASLGRWVRRAATFWGTATSRWRMEPDFIIVGAQRCGTTTLYRVLSEHPDVVRPTLSKGIGYFDLHYARGRRWYRGHFPVRFLADRRARHGRAFTFESSGYYLFHPLAAERIAADLPRTRLVVLVRDPVERAYSAHRHELARGFETEPFEEALKLEDERLAGEEQRLVEDPSYQSFEHRHHGYLARGRYAPQIRRLQEAVGDDRVYVMDADRFFDTPQEEFARLCAWLGMPAWTPDAVEQWNARQRDPMPAELRRSLEAEFADLDDELSQMLGRPVSWRDRSGRAEH
ncbi:sulfotransferase family protein [Mumia quercus]|uniref:sulfotransferase family protein n=1 Tax=Mumia quercus TaxID=2976125 RepID=UPI0021D167DB|nr:sulfotransferase [Mumia quercus]